MTAPVAPEHPRGLAPVHMTDGPADVAWADRLVVFLRVMAAVSFIKGLYHWAVVLGVGGGAGLEAYVSSFQVATVYFAIIDLVAAIGLWLAAPWGAVVWLTAVISMVAVEMIFPHVYGGRLWIMGAEMALLAIYLWLALQAAREQHS